MSSPYRLVVRTGPRAGQPFHLDKDEIFIGRDLANDLVVEDPEVSRRHARVFVQGNAYLIEDLGSTNGTSVNGQRLTAAAFLRAGDVITLGEHTHLVFEAVLAEDAPAPASPAEDAAPEPHEPLPPVETWEAPQAYTPPPEPAPLPPYQGQAAPPPPPYQGQAVPPPPPPYQGQPNPAYGYEAAEAPAARRPVSTTVIILVVVVVCLLIPCLVFAVVDFLDLYCTLFPGIVNMFVEGYCP